METKIKRTIGILLAVCFLVSLTATAVNASSDLFTGPSLKFKCVFEPDEAKETSANVIPTIETEDEQLQQSFFTKISSYFDF